MAGRPELSSEGPRAQEIVEKVAEISDILFRAPHAAWSYLLILFLPQLLVPLAADQLGDSYLEAMWKAEALFAIPGVVTAAGAWRVAAWLGGSFNRRRSAFLAAGAQFTSLLIAATGYLVSLLKPELSFPSVLLVALSYTAAIQVAVLFTTSDHRLFRSGQVALLQPLTGILILHLLYPLGARETALSLAFVAIFLLTTIFFLDFIDTPVRRVTGVSFSLMFRYYIDHLSKGTLLAETLFDKTQTEIEALIGVAAFRTEKGLKAAMVVPAVHPGPIGEIGGSNLPKKIQQTVGLTPHIMVPHGPATHDFNPISTRDVERLGEAARRLIETMPFHGTASPLVRAGTDAQVCAQFFGDGCLLTYTSWPKPIDDVDYGVGEPARMAAMMQGATDALFIDAHNSLVLGSGAVWPSTRRAQEIKAKSAEAARLAKPLIDTGIKAGYAQTAKAFTAREGIGDQGCQVLVTEVGGKKSAYILWDGNNMLPEVRGEIRNKIQGLVDEFEVMTTDNHSVNIVTGGYNPVGHRANVQRIAEVTRATLEAALKDLEPCEVGLKTTRVPGLKVFGHWNTIRFIAAVQTMVTTIPRATIILLVLHGLLTLLLLLLAQSL